MKLGKANMWNLPALDRRHEYSGQMRYILRVKSAVMPRG